jgi:hypothetical protein
LAPLFEPGVAWGERHHLRLTDHRDGFEFEGRERLADRQPRFGKMAFDAASRLTTQPSISASRTVLSEPQPYLLDVGRIYAYPTKAGKPINPYITKKRFKGTARQPDGFGVMLVKLSQASTARHPPRRGGSILAPG